MKRKHLLATASIIALLACGAFAESPAISAKPAPDSQESDPKLKPMEVNWGYHEAPNANPALPNVLLIGDSIVGQYHKQVRQSLEGKANVSVFSTGLHEARKELLPLLQRALQQNTFAVVHFNIGLHGLAEDRVPSSQYEPLMRAFVATIKAGAPNARLIWASTTPVVTESDPSILEARNSFVVERNPIAAKIMGENGIAVDDLYGVLAGRLAEYKAEKRGDAWHWGEPGVKVLADSVTASITKALGQPGLPQDKKNEPDLKALILTPKPPATPRINGARVFGVRPGHPFLFQIPATGERPMKFAAENLPAGLSLDAATGQITGTIGRPGTTVVRLHAENKLGKSDRDLKIICGEKIALTPPLGWNSWNCLDSKVDQEAVKKAADKMVETGLINHGFSYINIDDTWEGERDADGFIQPNKKFPDMKALADYIHSKGLKFGIYSSPGPKTCGKFEGTYQHDDKDAQRYGEWGVDYVKYDRCSYEGALVAQLLLQKYIELVPEKADEIRSLMKELAFLGPLRSNRTPEQEARLKECHGILDKILAARGPGTKSKVDKEIGNAPYKKFRAALDKVPRDIVYSFSGGPVGRNAIECGGNCWRTAGDLRDVWKGVSNTGFGQNGNEKFAAPGQWNDPDMLVIGTLRCSMEPHPTRLTPDEQFTHITLWSLLCSPLLIGCDMTRMDDFTLSLLSNDEVLEVNQDPLGKQAARVSSKDGLQVWAKEMEDGSKAVGLFNLNEDKRTVKISWDELGIKGNQTIRDLWRQKDIGSSDKSFAAEVNPHGAFLLKVSPAK